MNQEQTQRKLTAKQHAFCHAYANLGSNTYLNQYQSAIKAGYAETTAKEACQNILANQRVQAEIARIRAEESAKVDMSAEEIIERIIRGMDLAERMSNLAAHARYLDLLSKIKGLQRDTGVTGAAPQINFILPEGLGRQEEPRLRLSG